MRNKARILVIDDTVGNLKVVSGLLKGAYQIMVATRGEEALQLLASGQLPDLILLDVMMPGMDGYQVCEALKAAPDTRDIPVIFLTARTDPDDEARGFALGAADYVTKPISPPTLKARVKAQLALAAQLREKRQALSAVSRRLEQVSHERDLSETERRHIEDRQQALLALTRAALRDLTLDQYLEDTLRIIASISWLNLEPRGLLFLLNRKQELILIASHGVAAGDQLLCRAAREGRCPCGQASRDSQAVFTAATSIESDHCLLKSLGSGSYSLALEESDRAYGILAIVTPEGHEPIPGEMDFMTAVAQTFTSLIRRRIAEETLRISQVELQMARNEVVRRLGVAAELRDTDTGMHVIRMSQYAGAIARAMGCDRELCELIELAAPMHDVGKIGVHDNILRKPGKLTPDEFAAMQEHTLIGSRILEGEDPLIRLAREIALTHHEKWDGSGYPHGLAREEIPLTGRICAVADVFDALTMARPYKDAWPVERAVEVIRDMSGSAFDPEAVAAFNRCLRELIAIKARYRDDTIDPRETLPSLFLDAEDDVWIPWSDAFSVGNDVIDEHHRYLIYWTNRVHKAISQSAGIVEVAKGLAALEEYTRIHFRAEERLIEAAGYAGLEAHKQQHHDFEAELAELRQEILHNPFIAGMEMLEYLRQWLLTHILKSDKAILRGGLSAAPHPLEPGLRARLREASSEAVATTRR